MLVFLPMLQEEQGLPELLLPAELNVPWTHGVVEEMF